MIVSATREIVKTETYRAVRCEVDGCAASDPMPEHGIGLPPDWWSIRLPRKGEADDHSESKHFCSAQHVVQWITSGQWLGLSDEDRAKSWLEKGEE